MRSISFFLNFSRLLLPQDTCIHLYKIYILPVLTYGLGIFSMKEDDIKPINQFQKNLLKQLLSLADNVAHPTVHLLSGIPPVEYEIHRQALGFLGSVARKESSVEYSVGKRQLIMKTSKSPSWFNHMKDVCIKYDLPSPREILDMKMTKNKWKFLVKSAVTNYSLTTGRKGQHLKLLNTLHYAILTAITSRSENHTPLSHLRQLSREMS